MNRAFLLILTVALLAAGGVVAWIGTRDGRPAPPDPSPVPEIVTTGPVHTIELPHEEPELPPGPHREVFASACTLCHSPRLVLTQPRLSQGQWQASVQKMIKVYGAPIVPEQEKQIVAYLTTVMGKDPSR